MDQFKEKVIRTTGREIITDENGVPIPGQNIKEFKERRRDNLFENADRGCKTLLECLGALERCPEYNRAIMCHMINEVWTIRETLDRIKRELRR